MKIPLSVVKLKDQLDTNDPLATVKLTTAGGWKLTLDTDIGCIQGILTRGEGDGARVTRVEFHASVATHWQRENWGDPIDFTGMRGFITSSTEVRAADILEPKPKPTGGKRGRKGPRAGSSEAHRVQPEGAGGDDPQP